MSKFLLLLPQHNGAKDFKPAGQITAASGLISFFMEKKVDFELINLVPSNFFRPVFICKIFNAALRIYKCITLLKKGDIDAMVAFTGSFGSLPEKAFLCFLCKVFDVNACIFFRNSDILQISSTGALSYWLRFLLSAPSIIFVQGRAWEEKLLTLGLGKEKIKVIPNWLPPTVSLSEEPKICSDSEQVNFIFAGRIIRSKGVFDLLEAIFILNKIYSFSAKIVGDGPDLDLLKKHCSKLGLSNTEITGWVSPESLIELEEKAHVFVHPSYYPEGFPNSILEAMAGGLPVVSCAVGAVLDSVESEKNGYIVPPKSPLELSSAMERYLIDKSLISKHSEGAIKTVQQRHQRSKNCNSLLLNLKVGKNES